MIIEQPIHTDLEEIREISLLICTYARENTCNVEVRVLRGAEEVYSTSFNASGIVNGTKKTFPITIPLEEDDSAHPLLLQVSSPDAQPGNAITLYYCNSVDLARGVIPLQLEENQKVRVNGQAYDGILCYGLSGWSQSQLGSVLRIVIMVALLLCGVYLVYNIYMYKQGKTTFALRALHFIQKNLFLLQQLVTRDFNAKYKRSALGVIWSFFNPLLTMLVQYVVFSTLFSSGVDNYVVFLFSGIVVYSFFSEATTFILTSIVDNTALISKVHTHKLIFPISRVLSAGINFGISFSLLLLITLISGTPIQASIFFVPYAIVCLMLFALGLGLILASVMVFFRDIQFIYGVLITILMYLTPIFYPASALPNAVQLLFKFNPIYHILTFVRSCLIDGNYPGIDCTLSCFLSAVFFLLVGSYVFRKTQNNFTFYL